MLQLQLSNVLRQRGIQDPIKFLVKKGFTYHTAHRLVNNLVDSVSYSNLEKLCIILNCTINDLFLWSKDNNDDVSESHPINKLAAEANPTSISQALMQLPYDKIMQLEKIVNELKNMQ
jgi:DNA-binding Xre family transcriptional regulator